MEKRKYIIPDLEISVPVGDVLFASGDNVNDNVVDYISPF